METKVILIAVISRYAFYSILVDLFLMHRRTSE